MSPSPYQSSRPPLLHHGPLPQAIPFQDTKIEQTASTSSLEPSAASIPTERDDDDAGGGSIDMEIATDEEEIHVVCPSFELYHLPPSSEM